jgi:hypothetical protein
MSSGFGREIVRVVLIPAYYSLGLTGLVLGRFRPAPSVWADLLWICVVLLVYFLPLLFLDGLLARGKGAIVKSPADLS